MYDVIVTGARCAGSPLSMLLASKGYNVLLVEKAVLPSDTISTHFIWPPGLACLKRWGLLERLKGTGCPVHRRMGFDPGPFQIYGTPPESDGVGEMMGPRRTVLDKLLRDAAESAGVEVAEGFTVTGVTSTDGRVTGVRGHGRQQGEVTIPARMVVGADGRRSTIAAAVGAEEYNARPAATCLYYSYWRDVPEHPLAVHVRPRRFMVSTPTNHGLTIGIVLFPIEEFEAVKADIESAFWRSWDMVPEIAEKLRAGKREERFYGAADNVNFFRKPYGDGWALAGDAGYHKDPITAQGISDAFQSVEWLASAIDAGLSGARPMSEALEEYRQMRDAHFGPMYDFTYGLAGLQPPAPEMQALFGALRGNQAETDRFMGTMAGTVPIPEYYSPENMQRIVGASAAAAGGRN